MPGALTDLTVAARLGLRELGRAVRGRRERAPDLEAFRTTLASAIAAAPPGVVAEHTWIRLPASEPPWRDSGVALRAGEELSYFAAGRAVASPALDVWIGPETQLWARVGEAGPIRSSSRTSNTLRAESGGRVYFGNYFPNDWKDARGARLQDDAVYSRVSGEIAILALRWNGSAAAGLAALAAAADPIGCFASERERLLRGDPAPPGWRHLWHLGETEIFSTEKGPTGEPALVCACEGDVGILQRDAPFPLRPGTQLAWRWRVDALPGLVREDTVPSHDYLSLAVEFQNGLDITYYWSKELAPGTAFWCPLPNWKHREFHVVVRSGAAGLGAWHPEQRDLHADALRYFGKHPGDVVRVWLIAVSIFKRQPGRCAYAGIELRNGSEKLAVL
ncbi:MAG TPA: DUF3047 domain-containing protein [Myxococcota bacterium]|nr:DUF3047 domain-containing protein [Myxococcota bacterium]